MSLRKKSLALLIIGILGAVAGYLRELSLAVVYGVGRYTDAYFVAMSIPMVVGDMLVGSALTAAIVPVLSRHFMGESSTREDASRLFGALALTVVAVGFIAALALFSSMEELIRLLAPGFSEEARSLAVNYGRWLVWLLPINGLLLLATLSLNAARIFVKPAVTWLYINVSFFLMVLLGKDLLGDLTLVSAALSGPAVMLVWNFWLLKKEGLLGLAWPDFRSGDYKKVLELARPVLLTLGIGSGMGLLMVSHVLLRSYGSHLGEGVVSALGYAFRLYEVPVSLLTATAGTLVLPYFAAMHHAGERLRLAETCKKMLAWGMLLLVPAAALTFILSEPIVRLLFDMGAFKGKGVQLTAEALRGFAPAVIFETMFMILFRVFYASHRPKIPVTIGVTTAATLLIALELTTGWVSVSGLAAQLSLSFLVASALSLIGIALVLGREVLPAMREVLIVVGVTLAVGMGTWWIEGELGWGATGKLVSLSIAFVVIYVFFVAILLPGRTKTVLLEIKKMQHIL